MSSLSPAEARPPFAQIAKDFGVSVSYLKRWLTIADREDGITPVPGGGGESAELREARKRVRLLEQENEVLRRAAIYLERDVNPK
jgi:transposase